MLLKKLNYCFLFILLLISIKTKAQDWERRHQFAKAYFGVSNYIVPNVPNGSYLDTEGNGSIQSFTKSGFMSPAINIGATHFWGYADFYISINTASIKMGQDEIENSYRFGTFTGLRVYPFASKERTIRPYLGYKFSPFRYKQEDINGQKYGYTQVKSVFDIGLGIQLPKFYFTMEYSRVLNPSFDTYLSRTVKSVDQFPSQTFQIGLNYMIETTKSASRESNKQLNKEFGVSNKWGLFLAIGPSSAFPTASSSYVTDLYPFLDNKAFPGIFADIAIGYHFTKLDLITAVSYRQMTQKRSAYELDLNINRKGFNFEAYKFLVDYHGFVPYVGLGVSYEDIHLTENNNGVPQPPQQLSTFTPNIVFGWDIRPSVKGDWWILRTNLRYFPLLELERQQKSLSLQFIEFNFIQFVFYPQRLRKLNRMNF
ncbi:hypothetical protein [Flammeovirga aprica]|uniref:Outer membrane protein beta-barrel domain-containing protein n=1 Tax=Flammeovirga aprica JL-4 TaxID=694437 RepID=A0A7X9P305_9BACT|nr:hypothetical protein [Flammeovirga aprica]NME68062.1 hypothetical protein [Flammeovirga aprica JL-4]